MSVSNLNSVIFEEYKSLQGLLTSLEEQFQYLTKREVFALDNVKDKIEQWSRQVAKAELERRKITNGKSMSKIVEEANNSELEKNYKNVKEILNLIQIQKESNEILIKQGLGYTTQMLRFLNPDKAPKTYNSYGKRR